MTLLTGTNKAALIEDALERDADGFGRAIALIGTVSHEVFQWDADVLRAHLTAFARGDSAPIQIVISQVSDSPVEHMFTYPSLPMPVRELFRHWQIVDAQPAEVTAYRLLWTARLENLIDSIVAHAF